MKKEQKQVRNFCFSWINMITEFLLYILSEILNLMKSYIFNYFKSQGIDFPFTESTVPYIPSFCSSIIIFGKRNETYTYFFYAS
jgi:hypothetical protein